MSIGIEIVDNISINNDVSLTNSISKYITGICKLGIFSINDEHFVKYVYGYGLHSCGDAKKCYIGLATLSNGILGNHCNANDFLRRIRIARAD